MYYKNIYYIKKNEGKNNIIFLHGWGACHNSFNKVFDFFDENVGIYLLDLEGFGNSKINYPYTLDDYSNNIIEMIEELKISNPIIIGHSFGGRIALKMLEKKPFKTILVSTPGFDHRSIKTRINLFLNRFKKKKKLSDDYKNASRIMKETMVNCIKDTKKIRYNNIKLSPLIIHGKNDKVVLVNVAKKMAKKLKTKAVLLDSNHFPQYDNSYKLYKVIKSYANL